MIFARLFELLVAASIIAKLCYIAADAAEEARWLGWVWYVWVQLVQLIATVVGWFLLIPFCLSQAWFQGTKLKLIRWRGLVFRGVVELSSIKDDRPIDAWGWLPLNAIYGNPEDGVSGQCALVWVNGVNSPYMPNAPAWWRAYCWSALRNSCDALKYRFAWENGPQALVWGYKLGWWEENGKKVPLL